VVALAGAHDSRFKGLFSDPNAVGAARSSGPQRN
jgi:hypothetical protein